MKFVFQYIDLLTIHAIHRLFSISCKVGSHDRKHTHTQPFYGSVEFVRDNPGEPVPEETFS